MTEVVVTPADNGGTCALGPHDVLVVRLPENPTTGFLWAVDHLDDLLVPGEAGYAVGGPGIGAAGTRRLTFHPRRPGRGRLALKLWQEWEGDASVLERFALAVVVA